MKYFILSALLAISAQAQAWTEGPYICSSYKVNLRALSAESKIPYMEITTERALVKGVPIITEENGREVLTLRNGSDSWEIVFIDGKLENSCTKAIEPNRCTTLEEITEFNLHWSISSLIALEMGGVFCKTTKNEDSSCPMKYALESENVLDLLTQYKYGSQACKNHISNTCTQWCSVNLTEQECSKGCDLPNFNVTN